MPSPSEAQSHIRFPLTTILGSAGNVRVLRALVNDQSAQSAPHIARQAGLSPQGARLVLDALARQQLVQVLGSGRAQLHTLNQAHSFAAALGALFLEESTRWEHLLSQMREKLAQPEDGIEAAWLYGSVARGEDTARSDLDVAVLVSSYDVADRLREELVPLEAQQQVHISLTALTHHDLAALSDGDPWWSSVVRDARVLIGPAPEAAKRQVAQRVAA